MKITLLGTGTPTPSLKRASSGYLIEIGDDRIVMDHGPGSHHRLIESGTRAVDISHVFLSHLHYDHCMEYPRLVLQRWDMGADLIPDLQVYGPSPLARMTEQLFSEDGVWGPDIRARISHQGSIDVFEFRGGVPPRKWPAPRVREVHAGDVVETNRWKVTVGTASHVQPYLECLAFRVESEEGDARLLRRQRRGARRHDRALTRLRRARSHVSLLLRQRADGDLSGGLRQPHR